MNKSSMIILVFLSALLALSGCDSIKRWMWAGPGRDDWQNPDQVVAALGLETGNEVADLGSGGGYFTFRMAEAVGDAGRVYAVDIEQSLLDYIAEEAEKRGLGQIKTILAPVDGLGLPDASVDLIFLSNVYHHLPDPADYFRRARSTLKSGGRIAVLDFSDDGLLRGHATPADKVKTELEAAGYRLAETHAFLERQSFQIFVIVPDAAGK
jgi:arsenite methyltransferase